MSVTPIAFKLRVPRDRVERWRLAADAAGAASLSDWARGVLDAAAERGDDPHALRAELVQLRSEIHALGNNVNQLARIANQTRVIESEAVLAGLAKRLAATLTRIRRRLR